MRKAPRLERSFDRRVPVICALLVGAVWAVFGRTVTHQFVNFDDEVYVYANPTISRGLSADGLLAAFTQSHARNWHPLTTISHMLDCQIFGLNAGGHHAVDVVLHSAAAAILFIALRRMTGALWRSAFVAAAFALHPLRAESVAWVAERKDVLSGLFFMLTMNAYVLYVRSPNLRRRYFAVVGWFAAGLMCKPMLVTMPLVLLLLDRWPFDRFRIGSPAPKGGGKTAHRQRKTWHGLVVEKLPLLALSAISCAATLMAQSGSIGAMAPLPITWRLENAVVTMVVYLAQIVWPANLAAFYPHPAGMLPLPQVFAAIALTAAISGLAIRMRKTQPWLLTGWLWYLVMLLPVIGLVQAGMQARADRYTYLPHIGIFIAITWSLGVAVSRWRVPPRLTIAAAAAYLVTMSYLAFVQTGYWRDSRTLWTHAAAVTHENEVAENNLGILLEHDGRIDDAISHYQTAVAIQTRRGQGRYDLTLALVENNLGNAYSAMGETGEAIAHYSKAVELRRDYADGWYNLGVVLLTPGRQTERAIGCFEKTLALRPTDAAAHGYLGDALRAKHADSKALEHYEKALALAPRELWALHSLGWLLATSPDAAVRDPDRTLQLAQRAFALPSGENAAIFRMLAAAHGAKRNFVAAIAAAERGAELARAQGDRASWRALQADLELYRESVPVREITPVQ